MRTSLFIITIATFLLSSCGPSLEEKLNNLAHWDQIKMTSKDTYFYKIQSTGNAIWASTYGTGKVYKSTDDGKNWVEKASLGCEYIERIQFVNNNFGYLCGDYGYVYKTVDGGETWKESGPTLTDRIVEKFREDKTKNQKPKGWFVSFTDMYFENAKSGYIWGFYYDPFKGYKSTFDNICYTTVDGGENWTLIAKNQTSKVTKDLFSRANKSSVTLGVNNFYLDNDHIWKTTTSNKKGMQLEHSKDAGLTWTKMAMPTYKGGWEIKKTLFTNPNQGYIFGRTSDKSNKTVAFQTKDSGLTWTPMANEWTATNDATIHKNSVVVATHNGTLYKSPGK